MNLEIYSVQQMEYLIPSNLQQQPSKWHGKEGIL